MHTIAIHTDAIHCVVYNWIAAPFRHIGEPATAVMHGLRQRDFGGSFSG